MRAPEFWSRPDALAGRALAPLGWLYGAATRRRLRRPGVRLPVPVLCVGNLGAGGAGKTPACLALARLIAERGGQPGFIASGYRAQANEPRRVRPEDPAALVGDEALELVAQAPTWVCTRRIEAALRAVSDGAAMLILDDGFQAPDPCKDLSIVVVDGAVGFGNGRLIPAGPLRERVADGLPRAGALLLVGEDRTGVAARLPPGLPLLGARILAQRPPGLEAGAAVRAFAGIARPAKFLATLAALDLRPVETRTFPDHHPFDAKALRELDRWTSLGAVVTTRKDWVRLPPGLRAKVTVLDVRLAFDRPSSVAALLSAHGILP